MLSRPARRVTSFDALADQVEHFRACPPGRCNPGRRAVRKGARPIADRPMSMLMNIADHVAVVAEYRFLDVREELPACSRWVGARTSRGIGLLADILGAVDDLQVAVGVESRRRRS